MKIAVASNDGIHISPHFGRSAHFIIFDIKDGAISNHTIVDNTFTAHAKGECESGEHHHDQPHSHATIIDALQGCEIVLCGGMGWRAAEDLMQNGIKPIAVNPDFTAQDAVNKYIKGELTQSEPFCSCH